MIAVDAQHRGPRRTPRYCGSDVQQPQERGQHHDTATRIHRPRRRLRQPLCTTRRSFDSHIRQRQPARIITRQCRIFSDQAPKGQASNLGRTLYRRRPAGCLRAHPTGTPGRPIPTQQRRSDPRSQSSRRCDFHRHQFMASCPEAGHHTAAQHAAAHHSADRRSAPARCQQSHARSARHRGHSIPTINRLYLGERS
jgi:hypothetical protein